MLNNDLSKHFILFVIILTVAAVSFPAVAADSADDFRVDQQEIDEALGAISARNPFELMRAASQPARPAVSAPAVVDEDAPELFVEAVMLKFLRAKNIMPAVEVLVAPWGTVSTDEDTNTLIVSGSREDLDNALAQVRKADQMPKQIMIDVVILDVVLDDDTEIGVDWNQTTVFGGINDNQNYQHALTTLTTGATFNIFSSGIDVTVRALQQHKDVEILSSPRLMVLSGRTANIKTVEEIPYEESSDTSEGGTLTSISFKEAGIALEVSPIITDEGKIILNVKPSQSVKTGDYGQAGTGASGIPIVDKREVDTTLILDDGQTVVIGGLRKKHETITNNKIPLFGDIPVVGNLFRNDKTEIVNSELLVMLCPKIYRGTERLDEFENAKFNELKERQPLQFDAKAPQMIEDFFNITDTISSTLNDR